MGFGFGKGQEMSCGESCMKYLLFLFNILFFLCGAGLLGVGIWLKVDAKSLEKYITVIAHEGTNYYDAVAYSMIGIGAFIFLIGFLGCCGACSESKCMLGTYAFLVIVIVLIEVLAAILIAVFNSKLQGTLRTEAAKTVKHSAYESNLNAEPDVLSKAWNFIQFNTKCCGVEGYMDYDNSTFSKNPSNTENHKVPAACCKSASGANDTEDNPSIDSAKWGDCDTEAGGTGPYNELYDEGCYDQFIDEIKGNLWIVIGICVGVLLFEILAITFACCVMKAI